VATTTSTKTRGDRAPERERTGSSSSFRFHIERAYVDDLYTGV